MSKRVAIPVVMLEGNFEVLEEHHIEVGSIGVRRYRGDDFGEAYVITIQWESDEQEAAAKQLGFRTEKARLVDR